MPVPLIAGAIVVGKIAGKALVGEMVSRGLKELEELYKGKGALDKHQAKNRLKEIEMVKYEIEISKEYATATKAQKTEMLKLLNKEKDELVEKNKLSKDEADYEQAKGRIEALNEKAKYGSLNDEQKLQLACSKEIAYRIKAGESIAAQTEETMLIEEQSVKASIAGYNNKKKAQEEAARATIQIEIEAQRQADDNMKKKEEAMKNLAEFDERMKISSLNGEERKQAQLLANYKKQKAEIEAMHESQLLYAEDDITIKEEQCGRLLDMEATYQAEKEAIIQEFAEMEAQRRYQEDEAARAMAEQWKREEEELRDLKIQASADTLGNMAQVFEGNRKYAALYKTSAIGEATINAIQSVLKTMAGTPFPWNIALAASQAAVAGVQVSKIASTKMSEAA